MNESRICGEPAGGLMKQQTLTGFERYAKTTRRAQFLADMHVIVPWAELMAVVEPFYPKISEAGGRPPLPLERMLRVYFLQLWLNLSDPAVEEALYESTSMRNFVGIDLGVEAAPDETTVCKFRHLLDEEQTREEAAWDGERAPEAQRHQDHDRDDCRCDDHWSAEFDEEQRGQTRPGDASDRERETMVLRHESAHRSR
jgi:hypothetical protein